MGQAFAGVIEALAHWFYQVACTAAYDLLQQLPQV